jgi:hypothetical protein
MRQWVAQGKAAQAAGDTDTYKQIEDRMKRLQFTSHAAVFSNAVPRDALDLLARDLPSIAESARVSAIVSRLDFQAANVEVVDVTQTLVARFNPSPDVQKMVEGLRKAPMVDLYDATHDEH